MPFHFFDQPPQGVEEGRWLALRKLCLCLAGAKTKDLLRSSYHDGAGGGGSGGGGVDGGDGAGGVDLMGAVQEALVRSLCGSRPEAQVRLLPSSSRLLLLLLKHSVPVRSTPLT